MRFAGHTCELFPGNANNAEDEIPPGGESHPGENRTDCEEICLLLIVFGQIDFMRNVQHKLRYRCLR